MSAGVLTGSADDPIVGVALDFGASFVFETAGFVSAFAGLEVMALSGLSKCWWSGPNPNAISARESGIILVCQPWSA